MFASKRVVTIDVPEEVGFTPGQRVTIRGLSRTVLREALIVAAQKGIEQFGAARVAGELAAHELEARERMAADAAIGYDWPTLIERAVVEWLPPRPAPMRQSALEAWLARAIVEHSRPGR
jgi:hypothetical protein